MTITTTTATRQFNGDNSTTVFAYNFKILATSDIDVYLGTPVGAPTTWTQQTETTHYSVSGATDAGGGDITFVAAPPTGTGNVYLRRKTAQTQSTDYVENSAFPADSHETALDRVTVQVQELQEEVDRCFKLGDPSSPVPDAGAVNLTDAVAARASKVVAFDSSGDLASDQELGTHQGNWATSTTYALRDIVKDSSNNNGYICVTAHTSTGSTPISSNADVAKWTLIIDAASATTSATAAAASATSAASSATSAASSATSAASSATSATSSASAASTSASAASTSASAASTSATAAATSATSAASDAVDTAADAVSTASDAVDTAADVTSSGTNATNAASSASTATTQASAASTSATAAATSATSAATSATTATTQASAASTSASAAAVSAAAAAASADGIDDVYLGAKSSDPATDNDGDALNAGDWYWNTTSSITRIYNGSAWEDVSVSPSTVVTKTSTTGSASLPAGTTVQRDGSPSAGYLRWNTSDTSAEVYDGSGWVAVGGGNTTTEGLYEHAHTISANYSITSGNNALTAGPITIDTGVSVTVPTGSTWVIA